MPTIIDNRRILIVDDDQVSMVALAQRLERRGFVVFAVSSAENVLNLIESEAIECVLLDIIMPGVDGLSFLKELRKRYSKTQLPVMMVTAVKDSEDIVNVFEAGANDYLVKPVNLDVAVARIRAQLSSVDLHAEIMRRKQVEAVRAMVMTCCHEINNPMTIAYGALALLEKKSVKIDRGSFEKLQRALDRIASVSAKIKEVTEKNQLHFERHGADISTINLNRK